MLSRREQIMINMGKPIIISIPTRMSWTFWYH